MAVCVPYRDDVPNAKIFSHRSLRLPNAFKNLGLVAWKPCASFRAHYKFLHQAFEMVQSEHVWTSKMPKHDGPISQNREYRQYSQQMMDPILPILFYCAVLGHCFGHFGGPGGSEGFLLSKFCRLRIEVLRIGWASGACCMYGSRTVWVENQTYRREILNLRSVP